MSQYSLKILWLNKMIYYPKEEEGENTIFFRSVLRKVITSLSPEFSSFVEDLEIRLDGCPHPKTRGHRRVKYSLILLVQRFEPA